MTIPDHVVFDTEPLVAHANDELGSEIVEEYLDAVAFVTPTVTSIVLTSPRFATSSSENTTGQWPTAISTGSLISD